MNNLEKILNDIEEIKTNIGRKDNIKTIAISKYVSSNEIKNLYNQGQFYFGENKVQDLVKKKNELIDTKIEWHFVGRLQTNKINMLLDSSVALIQSVDSIKLAEELDKKLLVKNKKTSVLLQINSALEQQKAGVHPDEAIDIYLKIKEQCKQLNILGVMSIGAHEQDAEIIKKSFKKTYNVFEKLQKYGAMHCSMGMSGDYKLALQCGSNMLRLGSILFPSI